MYPKINFFLIFILLIILQGCGLMSNDQNIQANLVLDNYSYFVGDTLTGKFEVTNNSDKDKTFSFGSACQYGIIIKDDSTIYFELPENCATVLTKLHLKPDETREFNLRFKLRDQDYKNLNASRYIIQAFLLIENSDVAEKTIEIK